MKHSKVGYASATRKNAERKDSASLPVTIHDIVVLRYVVAVVLVAVVYVVSWQSAFALSRPLRGNSRHLLFFLIKS